MRRSLLAAVLLVTVACGAKTASGNADAGIRGRVLAGPQCPVVVQGSPCPDKPVSIDLKVQDADGAVITTVHSSADGRFEVGLDPGTYVLEPIHTTDAGFMFGRPVPATVKPHRFTTVTVTVDTGIR
jgi:hypothetical protein